MAKPILTPVAMSPFSRRGGDSCPRGARPAAADSFVDPPWASPSGRRRTAAATLDRLIGVNQRVRVVVWLAAIATFFFARDLWLTIVAALVFIGLSVSMPFPPPDRILAITPCPIALTDCCGVCRGIGPVPRRLWPTRLGAGGQANLLPDGRRELVSVSASRCNRNVCTRTT